VARDRIRLRRVGGAQLLEGLAPRVTPERVEADNKLIVPAVLSCIGRLLGDSGG